MSPRIRANFPPPASSNPRETKAGKGGGSLVNIFTYLAQRLLLTHPGLPFGTIFTLRGSGMVRLMATSDHREGTAVPGLARKARGLHPRGRAGVSLALGASIVVVGLLLIPSPARGAQRAAPDGVEVRLPPDLVFKQTVGDSAAVVFRHPTHAAFSGGQCVTCHPQPFKILHPTHRTSHAEMNAGRSCGICHNGRQAFGVGDGAQCARCHTAGRAAR